MEIYGLVVLAICVLLAGLIYAKSRLATGNGESRRSFTIGARILTGVAIITVVTAAMAALIIMRMTEVHEQLDAVADLNIIAIDTAILLNGEQREQGILLEQILRYAASPGTLARENVDAVIIEFHRRSGNMETAIGEDIAHLSRTRIHSTREADLTRERIRKLEQMQSQRAQFNAEASALFAAMVTGDIDATTEAAVTARGRKLNQLLQEYLLGVEDSAQQALGRARANGEQVLWLTVALAGTIVLVSLLLGWLGAGSIGRRLDRVLVAAARLRDGDLSGPPLIVHGRDESGVLALALDDLRSQLRLLAQHAEEIAAGRWSTETVLQRVRAGVPLAEAAVQVAEEGQPLQSDLADSFNKVSASLSSIAAQADIIAADDVPGGPAQPGVDGITDVTMAAIAEKIAEIRAALTAQTETVEHQRRQMLDIAARTASAAAEVYHSSEELSIRVQAASRSNKGQPDAVARAAADTGQMSESARETAGRSGILATTVNDARSQLEALSGEMASVMKTAQRMDQALEAGSVSVAELVDGIQAQSQSAEAVEGEAQQADDAVRVWVRLAREAASGMEQVAERVVAAASAVGEVGGRTNSLGEIASVLSDISEQSNLVALNAGIEAARAGGIGRGLAVVSAEAAKLSERITETVTQLNAMIDEIRRDAVNTVETMEQVKVEVTEGTQSILRSGKALEQVGGHAGKVSDLVGKMRAATDAQAQAGKSVVTTTDEIQQLAQRLLAAMAERSQSLDRATETVVDAAELANELVETAQVHSRTVDELACAVAETSDRAVSTTSAMEDVVESTLDLNRQAREWKESADQSNGNGAGPDGDGEVDSGDQGLLNTLAEN